MPSRIEETPYLCDVCTAVVPAWRYDIPRNFLILPRLSDHPQAMELRSVGFWGTCDACDKVLREPHADGPLGVARRLRDTMMANPLLKTLRGPVRGAARGHVLNLYIRLLPVLRNRRKAVRGEDPMDAKMLVTERDPGEPAHPGADRN